MVIRIGMTRNVMIRRARCNGHYVAIANCRDSDHCEIHQVNHAERRLGRIAQPFAIDINRDKGKHAQSDHKVKAKQQDASRGSRGPHEQRARTRRMPR
jgi:hypothetical protein